MQSSMIDRILSLGQRLNANQYQVVCLAAEYDTSMEWFGQGYPNAAVAIARTLDIQPSTAREWIRVGHALDDLPAIGRAFEANDLSYAKAQILTRWADPENELELLKLAFERSASRLTTAIAKFVAGSESEAERDRRQHDARSVTVRTDGEGMVVLRAVLPPGIGKAVAESLNTIMRQVAATPADVSVDVSVDASVDVAVGVAVGVAVDVSTGVSGDVCVGRSGDPSADGSSLPVVTKLVTERDANPFADGSGPRVGGGGVVVGDPAAAGAADSAGEVAGGADPVPVEAPVGAGGLDAAGGLDGTGGQSMADQLRQLKQQWQPADDDGFWIPTLGQQRADAFALLFLGVNVELVTEVVIHVRGDGATFDDGTPITDSAVCRRLDQSFIRALVHDCQKRPVNASGRRRFPTTRQKRVVLEAHGHECVDCQATDLLEFDHNPPYEQTRHTITTELEPRCAPCHRARHRQHA